MLVVVDSKIDGGGGGGAGNPGEQGTFTTSSKSNFIQYTITGAGGGAGGVDSGTNLVQELI